MDTERLTATPDDSTVQIRPGEPFSVMLALAAVLGSLCLPLAGIEAYTGIAMFVLSAFIVLVALTAGMRIPLIGLLLPSYMFVLFTGSFSFPAAVVGISVSAASVCLLMRGRRFVFATVAAAFAITIAALVRGAVFAALAALPFLAGIALALTYCIVPYKYSVAAAAGAVAFSVAVAGLIWFNTSGTAFPGLSGIADLLRGLICDWFLQITVSGEQLMNESSAAVLAEYAVNTLPGLAVCAVLFPALLQYKICEALWIAAGLEKYLPAEARDLELSPVSGIVCGLALIFYTAFSFSDNGFALSVCENIVFIIAPPFAIIGLRTVYRLLSRRYPRFKTSIIVALGLIGAIIPLGFIAAAAWFGMMHSLNPIYKFILTKFKNNEGDS